MDQQYNDWDFVDPPQKEFYCPLCEQILNEPKLTECCGKHFCTNCIDLQKPCPNPECNQEHFIAILDKPTWNKIKELDVLCPLKGRGCHWKGEMSTRVKHLDQNNETGCEYIDVACTNGCAEEMERYELPEHLKQFCHRRPYTCEHCGNENVFEVITKDHIPECPAHPITCQNNCGFDDITRSSYPEHLLKCPEQEIDCEFLYIGCEVKVKRKDSAQHQREGVYVHLSSQTAFATQQLSERDNKIEELSIAWENKHQHVLQTVETCREEQEKNSKQLKLELAQNANDIAQLNEQLETKDKAIEDLQQCLKDTEVKLSKALKDISTELNQALQNQSAEVQNTKLKADQLSVQFVRNKRAIEESIKQQAKEIEAKLLESREISQHKLMEGISAKVAKDINTMKKEIEAVSTTTDELKKKIEELDEKFRAAQMFQKPQKSSAIDKSSPAISSTDTKAKRKPFETRRSLQDKHQCDHLAALDSTSISSGVTSTVSVTKSLSLAISPGMITHELPSIHTGTQLTPHARATINTCSVSVVETPDKKLSLKDSANIESLLMSIANDWKLLGTQLGFSKKQLKDIGSVSAVPTVYLNRLLNKWLCGDAASPTTVSKLVGALTAMEGAETCVEIIFEAFNTHPAASATTNSPSADDQTKDDDGATASASATPTTPTNTLANISYPMDGSNVDKQDEETPLAPSSAGSSQDEQHQQLNQSAAPDYISTSSCVTNTAPTSADTTTISSSQLTSPPPGMSNLPPLQPNPGVYNDGQSWGNPGGQNGAAMIRTVSGGPDYWFRDSSRADSGYNGNRGPRPSKGPRSQGTTSHTLATTSPHSGNFGTNQGGNSLTGMNYSGAVARQDTGAGAVTVQPQATGRAGVSNSGTRDNGSQVKEEDKCPICLSGFKEPVKTKCGHVFCRGCIEQALQHNSFCPTCKTALKTIVGNQPYGQMNVQYSRKKLPGYHDCGTIEINYIIPDGIQGQEHSNPGQRFTGTARVAYLPDNPEGREVLMLLKKAFNARLIFTVGTSITSGQDNTVTWNGIHHKTSIRGGPHNYGYPDPGYLQRVKDDLTAKGIVHCIMSICK